MGDFCDGEWDSRVGPTMSYKCSGYHPLKEKKKTKTKHQQKKKHTQRNKKCGVEKQVKKRKMSTFVVNVGLCACPVCSIVHQCFLSKIQIFVPNYSGCPL